MTHLAAVLWQAAAPVTDHVSADDLLRYQMTARVNERVLPSGSQTITLTPAQLDDLALRYEGNERPVARA
ncbi:hypothetical protein ACWCOW_37490 [Streptomyces sp. NPDC001939]